MAAFIFDGKEIGRVTITADYEKGEAQTFTFKGAFDSDGLQTHRITVKLLNDKWDGNKLATTDSGHDRNLFVESVVVNGVTKEPNKLITSGSAGWDLQLLGRSPTPSASECSPPLSRLAGGCPRSGSLAAVHRAIVFSAALSTSTVTSTSSWLLVPGRPQLRNEAKMAPNQALADPEPVGLCYTLIRIDLPATTNERAG